VCDIPSRLDADEIVQLSATPLRPKPRLDSDFQWRATLRTRASGGWVRGAAVVVPDEHVQECFRGVDGPLYLKKVRHAGGTPVDVIQGSRGGSGSTIDTTSWSEGDKLPPLAYTHGSLCAGYSLHRYYVYVCYTCVMTK
jgi:hypothetical protein